KAQFLDLAALRSQGTLGALRRLRSCGAASVIVTDEESDFPVFRDILVLAAMVVPHARRTYAPPAGSPARIAWTDYPKALGRIALGIADAVFALAITKFRLAQMTRRRAMELPRPRTPVRCLYLKPALNLGTPVGGAVGHVAGVVNALHRRGHRIHLLAVARQPLVDSEVDQILVPPPRFTAFPNELNLFSYGEKYLERASQEVRKLQPDYIYQRHSLNDMTGISLRLRFGIPLILEFNGSETWIQKHWGRALIFRSTAEEMEAANLRSADLVVVVSQAIERQVRALGVPPERILFHPNGVDRLMFDPDRFDAGEIQRVRAALRVPPDADLFTFIGTFGRWHGTDILAAAIRRLIDGQRLCLQAHRMHFLFVGDGPCSPAVRSILGHAAGETFVTLAGSRPQVETPAILAASNVCLSPHVPNADGSPFFGSPTKLFEYMAMAKPIIASDLDQIGWVLRGWCPGSPVPNPADRTGAAALLVDPGSVESLVAAIMEVAAMDAAGRSRMGQQAQSFVDRAFTWDKNVDAVLKAFQGCGVRS
ncbi:MAG TPA: glycosyltransferase family 4 protein, partial [Acidobacteriota bacterium]|nr:glycosyltransferase family 4 protein [Acidobacteriota bacterium]